MTAALRVLVVEDHPTFRLGLRTRLEREADLRVVGEAATAQDAERLAVELAPDVAVVDLSLPDATGVELVERLAAAAPGLAVLVLTMLDDESVLAAVRAGARGYLLKDAEPARIVAAVRAVAASEPAFSPGAAQRLLRPVLAPPSRAAAFPELSDREHDVLSLVAAGYANPEIGRRLHLRPKTVRNYVSSVLTKLGAADRAEAVDRARRAGLGR